METNNHGLLENNLPVEVHNQGRLEYNHGNYAPREININAGSETRNDCQPETVNEDNLGVEVYNHGREAESNQPRSLNVNISTSEQTEDGKVPERKRGKFTIVTDFLKKVTKIFHKKKSN
jgi:hypothetical protein